MDPALEAALSWRFPPVPTAGILLSAALYLRGWLILRRLVPERLPGWRAACFYAGLASIVLSLCSPLDAFSGLVLSAHMIQHLLLTMVAPPLILLGCPFLPILRGLPRVIASRVLGPFLVWEPAKNLGRFLTHPVFCWIAFAFSNVFWHTPTLYELALRSPGWHQVEHAFFLGTALLFWWPVVQPWPSRQHFARWVLIPYLLLADFQNTALAAFLSFYERVLYPTYAAAPRLGDFTPLQDQAAAGGIMWVPGSIMYLVPAGLIAARLLSGKRQAPHPPVAPIARVSPIAPARRSTPFDLLRVRFLGPLIRSAGFRKSLQAFLFGLAALVVLDGFLGPQLGPMNLAGVLPWTHWRGFTIIALLVAGNLFCMACPFTFARDLGRGILPARWHWPRRFRSKWIAVALLAAYLWAYEAFHLWDSPWCTAWIIVGYFVAALLVDGFFKGASFCKYICPIGQFHFTASLVSPLEIRVREPAACATCRTHDCIRGNADQRGCELRLFQPKKSGNMDCTFCLDCIKACPHDNIGILPAWPGQDLLGDPRRSSVGHFDRRPDLAALFLLLVFGAFVNAAGMISPVIAWIDRLRAGLALHSTLPVVGVLLALSLVAVPALAAAICGRVSARLSASGRTPRDMICAFAPGLIPLGVSMWAAHFIFHLFTGSHTAIPVFQRLFHDAGFAPSLRPAWGIRSFAWSGLLGVELLLLDAGLLLTLYILWRKAETIGRKTPGAAGAFAPWAFLAVALFIFGVWILFQPMEMRGTFRN